MTLNIENLQKLKAWLEDGAPHVVFDMNYGVVPIGEIHDDTDVKRFEEIVRNKPGVGECGSVCCIGGAAYLMSKDLMNVDPSRTSANKAEWYTIEYDAMSWLGLECEDSDYGHKLFNPDLAPDDCTPQQAAQAVQNVIDGNYAWKGDE